MRAPLRSGSTWLLGAFLALDSAGALPQQPEAPASDSAEQLVLQLTNRDRAEQGLNPLRWDPSLAAAARTHAAAMMQAGSLSHQFPGEPDVAQRASTAGAHFRAIAENVAYGPDAAGLEKQWMHSTPHRTNILDPGMTAIGISIVSSGGLLYAVEDFAAVAPELSPAQVEGTVEAQLAARGLDVAGVQSDEKTAARAACPGFDGGAGAHARLVVRWESGDLHVLPQPLTDGLASGQYKRAAVGACPAINTRNQAFAAYRVAVLLF